MADPAVILRLNRVSFICSYQFMCHEVSHHILKYPFQQQPFWNTCAFKMSPYDWLVLTPQENSWANTSLAHFNLITRREVMSQISVPLLVPKKKSFEMRKPICYWLSNFPRVGATLCCHSSWWTMYNTPLSRNRHLDLKRGWTGINNVHAIFRMHNLFWVHCLCPSSLVSNPKWRLRDKGLW